MRFNQKVKNELSKIRETGKEYKSALDCGLRYGVSDAGSGAGNLIPDSVLNGNEQVAGIFLRGVFISCGSVTDPSKDYHLELVPPNKEKCAELLEFVTDCNLSVKQSERKGQMFLYCKSCEQITDFLTFIGATRHSMELINVMIYKEFRNNANRAANCDSANIDRTTKAATKQIGEIEFIFAEKGEKFLPSGLREVAVIRKSSAELTLGEIGDLCSPPLSKSGVNHRLKKISEIAEKLREKS